MAASGGLDLEGSIYKGSVEDFDIACEPCIDNGNFVEASGYCKNCNEYLCLACMKVHCVPKPSRHHVVLDNREMPQNKPNKPSVTSCTVTCDKHPSECLEFFCKKHNVTGCGDCMILDHKQCKVDYISTLSESYNTDKEYTSTIEKVKQLQAEVKDKLKDAGRLDAKTESTVKKTIADIKQYRKDVNTYFDQVERTLTDKCDEIKRVNKLESKRINDKLKSCRRRLASIHERLTSNINNTSDLFALTKQSVVAIVALEKKLKAIKQIQLQYVKFVKNAALTCEMSSETLLGQLLVSKLPVCSSGQEKRIINMVAQHNSNISVVDSTDTDRCHVSGLIHVSDNRIACTDWLNRSVKLVDIKRGKLLSTVSLVNQPWDITSISHDTFAVIITSSSKIQFLEVKNDILSLKNVIDVNGDCSGIDCVDDKLVVSFNIPPKVEIIDFHGNVLNAIQVDKAGTNLFTWPSYVAFSRDSRSIYVSDRDARSIIKLTFDGTVLASYKDSDLEKPRGMFVCRDGSVLICSSWSVHVISGDCKKQKLIITKKDGVYLPLGISFDDNNGILCVSKYEHNSSDVIQTYVTK